MLYVLLLIVPIICVVNVVFHATSLLMILLSLEAMILSVMFILIGSSIFIEIRIPIISVIVLSVRACETSLGLSILVIISRSYGSDIVNLLSISKC